MVVNPQRPNMIIRPTCYASHKHYDTAGMSNLKIQVSKLDPPTELRLYVGAVKMSFFLESKKRDLSDKSRNGDDSRKQ